MAVKPQSPIQAIHSFCKQCQNTRFSTHVEACNYLECPLWGYRMGKPDSGKYRTPLGGLKTYCMRECQALEGAKPPTEEVKNCMGDCPASEAGEPCPLFPFRMGKNPNRKGSTASKRKRS